MINDSFACQIARYLRRLKTSLGHGSPAAYGESGYLLPLPSIQFDRTCQLLITGGEEGIIKVWSAENGQLLSTLKGHARGIDFCKISPCNKYLATSSGDFTVRVWDIFE